MMVKKLSKMMNDEDCCLLGYNAVQFGENPKLSKFGLYPNQSKNISIEEGSEGYGNGKQDKNGNDLKVTM